MAGGYLDLKVHTRFRFRRGRLFRQRSADDVPVFHLDYRLLHLAADRPLGRFHLPVLLEPLEAGYVDNGNALAMRKQEELDARWGVKGARWNVIALRGQPHRLPRYAPYEQYVPGQVHVGTISSGRTGGLEIDYSF